MFGFWNRRHGFGPDMWCNFPGFFPQDELETLKNYQQNLEFYKKQLEKEITRVQERIKEMSK